MLFVWRNISAWSESCRKIFYIFFLLLHRILWMPIFSIYVNIRAMLLFEIFREKKTENEFRPIEEKLFSI